MMHLEYIRNQIQPQATLKHAKILAVVVEFGEITYSCQTLHISRMQGDRAKDIDCLHFYPQPMSLKPAAQASEL